MAANLRLIETTWNAILPRLREEKCAGCECLQGALMEIRLALEELPAESRTRSDSCPRSGRP